MKTHNVQLMSHLEVFYRRKHQIFYLIYHLTYRILSPNIVEYQEIYTKKFPHFPIFPKRSTRNSFSCDQNKQARSRYQY